MALPPTIYKFKIELSNINQNHYETIALTVAQHPSEMLERMMARVLAFTLHAQQQPVFGKGLSNAEEADIWAHDLDGQLALWVEVGEPAAARIKKASRLARRTIVYSFNSKSDVWWQQNETDIAKLRVSVYQFQLEGIQALAALAQRTATLTVIITDNSAYVSSEQGECEIAWSTLQAAEAD